MNNGSEIMEHGVAVVLIKDEMVLLTLRKAGQNKETWELPAGHIKTGETPEATATREVFEETGLVISNVKEVRELKMIENNTIAHIMYAEITGGTLANKEPDQHEKISWFTIVDLPKVLGPSAQYCKDNDLL